MFRNIISRSRWMSDYWLLNQFASEYLTHFCFWIGLTFMISESVRRRLWLVFPLHDLATMCEASLPSTNLLRQGAVPVLYTMNTVVGLLLHPPAACCLLKYNSSNGSLQTLSDRMTTTLGSCSRFFARWTIEYTVNVKVKWKRYVMLKVFIEKFQKRNLDFQTVSTSVRMSFSMLYRVLAIIENLPVKKI